VLLGTEGEQNRGNNFQNSNDLGASNPVVCVASVKGFVVLQLNGVRNLSFLSMAFPSCGIFGFVTRFCGILGFVRNTRLRLLGEPARRHHVPLLAWSVERKIERAHLFSSVLIRSH